MASCRFSEGALAWLIVYSSVASRKGPRYAIGGWPFTATTRGIIMSTGAQPAPRAGTSAAQPVPALAGTGNASPPSQSSATPSQGHGHTVHTSPSHAVHPVLLQAQVDARAKPHGGDHPAQLDKKHTWKGAVKDLLGGTFGGLGLVAVGHPFDTMKVRLATQPRHAPIYTGFLDAVQKTWAREGLKGFYAGVLSPIAGQAFLNATQFFAWGQSLAFVARGRSITELSGADYFLAGMLTGAACAVVETPIDLFKSQLQVEVFREKRLFRSVPHAVSTILQTRGVRGAYQGFSAAFVRNMPFRSIYFWTYENVLRTLQSPEENRGDPKVWKVLVAGGCAGFSQWITCYPLDFIKSSMQADSPYPESRKYKGYLDVWRQVYQSEGPRGFFRGLTPCLLRSFPANATCLMLFEYSTQWMNKRF